MARDSHILVLWKAAWIPARLERAVPHPGEPKTLYTVIFDAADKRQHKGLPNHQLVDLSLPQSEHFIAAWCAPSPFTREPSD